MLLLQGLQAAAKSPQFACWMLTQGLLYAHCLLAPEAAPIQAVCSPVAAGHVPGGRDHPLSSRACHSLRRKRLSRTCTWIWQTRWGPCSAYAQLSVRTASQSGLCLRLSYRVGPAVHKHCSASGACAEGSSQPLIQPCTMPEPAMRGASTANVAASAQGLWSALTFGFPVPAVQSHPASG